VSSRFCCSLAAQHPHAMWIQKCSTTLQQRKPLDKLTLSTKIQRFSMWGIGQNLSLPYGYAQLQLGVPSGFPGFWFIIPSPFHIKHPQFRNLVLVGENPHVFGTI
jgi:hypothetical protein